MASENNYSHSEDLSLTVTNSDEVVMYIHPAVATTVTMVSSKLVCNDWFRIRALFIYKTPHID